jgi:hypothetical protein
MLWPINRALALCAVLPAAAEAAPTLAGAEFGGLVQ